MLFFSFPCFFLHFSLSKCGRARGREPNPRPELRLAVGTIRHGVSLQEVGASRRGDTFQTVCVHYTGAVDDDGGSSGALPAQTTTMRPPMAGPDNKKVKQKKKRV